jgi:hypothetical protein
LGALLPSVLDKAFKENCKMANHKVYSAIVLAVKNGQLKEPFGQDDFRRTCPNLGEGTYKVRADST